MGNQPKNLTSKHSLVKPQYHQHHGEISIPGRRKAGRCFRLCTVAGPPQGERAAAQLHFVLESSTTCEGRLYIYIYRTWILYIIIYIYMYIFTTINHSIYIYIYMYICIYICIYRYIYIFKYIYMYKCIWAWICILVRNRKPCKIILI